MSLLDSSGLSADGRYVVFRSTASNLVSGDTNNANDVFVHDRQTHQTTRISVASDGAQSNGFSGEGDISGDGRYVAFESGANNLVASDTNNTFDVFVHDRQTGQTSRVSIASDGSQANQSSYYTNLSSDGRYVVYSSFATNLVTSDTNNQSDIFIHDRQTGQTTRVSVASNGSQANGGSDTSVVSSDDVTLHSTATDLVTGDSNGQSDVFVHDRQTGQTSRVSIASDGSQANGGSAQAQSPQMADISPSVRVRQIW
ncbi:MAG: hypothetical protein IPK19_00100 [Chloroflexi bacterium]|nr:hypothetical protein [Chloroflexota bacterium]